MISARQRLSKNVLDVTLWKQKDAWMPVEWSQNIRPLLGSGSLTQVCHGSYTCFRHNAYMNNSNGNLVDGDLYPVLLKLWKEARPDHTRSREICQSDVGFVLQKPAVQKSAFIRSVQLWSVNQRTTETEEVTDSWIRTKSVTVEEKTLVVQ
jgi:hypothetical protein